ncbi:MAG: hypothetical protein J6V09_06105 [Clostridia bacterium]|nr:hypothetical protein [Clostridia bacterium]
MARQLKSSGVAKTKNPNREGWDNVATQVFAVGEDSFALPLTSELDALFGENVNWFPCAARCGNPAQSVSDVYKTKNPNREGWDFCFGGATQI